MNYTGKIALVTGASSGIGKAYAKELAANGSDVILAARSIEKLNTLAAELSSRYHVKAYPLSIDLSKPEAAAELMQSVEKLGLTVDILINNAGFGTHGRFEEISHAREYDMMQVNMSSLVALTRMVLPAMRKRKSGIIVNVASVASFQPIPYMATYAASKAFVLSFTESIWAENKDAGIQVLALCPGTTKTSFFDEIGTSEMPGGINGTPESVVRTGFKGLAKGRTYIVDGLNNYWLVQTARFLTRRFTAVITERINRPSHVQQN
ncbi:SDR family NAD(P)-dependent oxidoreductase [Paenibacillus sp. 1P07SE]|uniref:SDR family NAD(P)-dependent oxidoreductase n=1 Tax=Paenibacillus sp. 1P07SE TaxID=3132209 RepID=UPI0039A7633F